MKTKAVLEKHEGSMLKAYSRVARLEYLPAEILLIFIPILLSITSPSQILSLTFAEAVAVFFLLYFTGFMANALSDRDVDSKYGSYKSNIARSVARMGVFRLKALLVIHVVVAMVLSAHLFYMLGNSLIPIFVALGLFLGVGYSLKPFNFKTRGIAHGLALALSAFWLPLAFLMVVLAGHLNFISILFFTGFTMAMYSLEFANQAMDYYEDKKLDLKTPSVRYSIKDSLGFALVLLPVGLTLTMISLVTLAITKFKDIHPFIADWMIVAIVSTLISLGFAGSARGMFNILKRARKAKSIGDARDHGVLKALKEVNHPSWQASGAMGVVLVCGILFGSMFFSFNIQGPQEPILDKVPEVEILTNPDLIVNAGDSVTFEATSHDDGKIISRWWDFGDHTGVAGDNATHVYNIDPEGLNPSRYTVFFTVTDDLGQKAQKFINITVTDLEFSNLEFKPKKMWTYTHVDFEFNVTNDKDLKHQYDLEVDIYSQNYQSVPKYSTYLGHDLGPAKIWNKRSSMDIALDSEPVLIIVLIQDVDGEQTIVDQETVHLNV